MNERIIPPGGLQSPRVSLILPFYRQQDHARSVIQECENALKTLEIPYEIIAVYNGITSLSMSSTTKKSESLIEICLRDAGWGYAVKAGMREARGEYICYTNSARTDMKELVRLLQYAFLSATCIVKATRIARETVIRKWISRLYNLTNRAILATPIWDVNATPKIFPRHILEQIGSIKNNGDGVDAEILYKAHKKNIPTIEIPSNHISRRGGNSSTKIISSGFKMFLDLFKIRVQL